jgi:hypothetical protein
LDGRLAALSLRTGENPSRSLDDPASSIHAAFEARRSESAFVPAYMLLNIAHWFDVEQAKSDAWRAKLDADKEAKKHQVKTLLEEAERTIDRMRRMAVGSLEQSARLRETLSTVNPENLPVELPPTFLPETLTGDRIEDFNSALARIHDVESEAKREFDKSMSEYSSSIDQIERDTKLDAGTVVELRHLLERREFTTLADRLNMLRTGQAWKPLLPSGSINWRLSEFRSMLPQLDKVDLLQVARNIDLGTQYGPLDYGALDPEHRQQATTIARAFTKLKPPKNASAAQIGPNVSEIVSQLLFEVQRCDEDPLADDTRHTPDLIKQEREAVLTSSDLLDRLGIPQQLIGFYRDLAAYADGSTITTTDFQSLCTFDGRNVSPRVVGIYSDLLGIISFPPDQSGQGIRKVDLNPLVHAALLRPE